MVRQVQLPAQGVKGLVATCQSDVNLIQISWSIDVEARFNACGAVYDCRLLPSSRDLFVFVEERTDSRLEIPIATEVTRIPPSTPLSSAFGLCLSSPLREEEQRLRLVRSPLDDHEQRRGNAGEKRSGGGRVVVNGGFQPVIDSRPEGGREKKKKIKEKWKEKKRGEGD